MRGWVLVLVLGVVASAQQLETAQKLYNRTDYTGALEALRHVQRPDDAAYGLTGQCEFMLGDFRKATSYFEKAAALAPQNSEYALWLGRAWGRRAEMASPFVAPLNASKARQYLEKSVALNPQNREALTDLFDYYLEAPGFLGGGFDKAEGVARQIARWDPAEYHYEMAEIARKRKQYDEAELQLRRAIQAAPHKVGRVVDLAKFLAGQGRVQESEAALSEAEKIAPDNPRLLYERASIYVGSHRNLGQARQLLKRYLNSSLTPEDPPRADAERLLRQAAGA